MSRKSAPAPAAGLEVRENFADTGYWAPTITTDANGQATVSITLPDNLTTWVLRAVGLESETRVGEGTVNVVATKPLLIRPVTPRFLVVGDVVELGAIINNNTDTPQTADVSLLSDALSSDEVTSSIASLVFGSERTIATIGVHDLLIIDTSDALLIVPRNRAQDVKAMVTRLKAQGSRLV